MIFTDLKVILEKVNASPKEVLSKNANDILNGETKSNGSDSNEKSFEKMSPLANSTMIENIVTEKKSDQVNNKEDFHSPRKIDLVPNKTNNADFILVSGNHAFNAKAADILHFVNDNTSEQQSKIDDQVSNSEFMNECADLTKSSLNLLNNPINNLSQAISTLNRGRKETKLCADRKAVDFLQTKNNEKVKIVSSLTADNTEGTLSHIIYRKLM